MDNVLILPDDGLDRNLPDGGFGVPGRCSRRGTTRAIAITSCRFVYAPAERRSGKVIEVVVAALVVLACAAILVVQVPRLIQTRRETAEQSQCADRLKELGIAIHNYHDENGSFPPAYLVDKDGMPMHSWRVLILPWLGEKGLYNQYRFEEPWNSPHNMAIGKKLGGYFHCPSDIDAPTAETSYMMIVGTGTISDGTSVSRIGSGISDGVLNTILLVEVTDSGVYWWEPRDLDASQMSFRINSASGTEIGSLHPGVANVLMCDGSVSSISDDTRPEQIRAMSTIAGGERIVPLGGGR